jgi:hypothetical protein
MNRRGESEFGGDILLNNVIFIILFLVFFGLMFYYVLGYQDGAVLWEDIYAKEIARVVNVAEPGSEVCLDVTKSTEIALGRGQSYSNIFNFDNVENRVVVSLRPSGGTSFPFFNNVDLINKDLKLLSGGATTNRLCFEVVDGGRE